MIVTVDNYLRFNDLELPYELQTAMGQELWMYNPDDFNEQVVLVRRDQTGRICLPRGYALRLRTLFDYYGVDLVWDDQRVIVPADIPLPTSFVKPIAYQMRAVQRMANAEQGIYEAPTASGKTVTAAILSSVMQQRTLIIVDKINLATQWQERFTQALGITPTIIGDGQWNESNVTLCTRQTLWMRRDDLDASNWWATWGAVFVDECHAVSAETVREILQRFPAYFRFGITATPDRHNWLMAASRGILGEIVCRTTEQELIEAGRLVKPQVIAVRTPFTCKVPQDVFGNNEWHYITSRLKTDPARSEFIRQILEHERGQTMLVQTDQTTHAAVIEQLAYAAGWDPTRVFMFTGQTSAADRDMIRLKCEEGNVLVISTIGKEAMDIPRLNRYMIAWPTKNDTATKQMIGRVKRVHETKTEAPIVFDLYDHRVPRLGKQFTARRGVYEREGIKLTFAGEEPVTGPR